MIISRWYHIATPVSLLVIVLVLVASVAFSLQRHPRRSSASTMRYPRQPPPSDER